MPTIALLSLAAIVIVGAIAGGVTLLWRAWRRRHVPGRCGACGYDLSGMKVPFRCPECGHGAAIPGALFGADPVRRRMALVGVLSVALGLGGIVAVITAPVPSRPAAAKPVVVNPPNAAGQVGGRRTPSMYIRARSVAPSGSPAAGVRDAALPAITALEPRFEPMICGFDDARFAPPPFLDADATSQRIHLGRMAMGRRADPSDDDGAAPPGERIDVLAEYFDQPLLLSPFDGARAVPPVVGGPPIAPPPVP